MIKLLILAGLTPLLLAAQPVAKKIPKKNTPLSKEDIKKFCSSSLNDLNYEKSSTYINKVCKKAKVLDGCYSVTNKPIFHVEFNGRYKRPKKILALSLIHGDEPESAIVATAWVKRLTRINSRSTWRVIPVSNPDSWALNQRMNQNNVDVNRNFPTKKWDKLALSWWVSKKKKDPRRYPGPKAASEPETRCIMSHIKDFAPDFIISVHTPLGLLDFDGPRIKTPRKLPLPWKSLGNYPGSLGRYGWKDNNIPVLTIELKGSTGLEELKFLDNLQDVSGTVALRADRKIKRRKKNARRKN